MLAPRVEDVAFEWKHESLCVLSFESKTSRGFRTFGLHNHLGKVALVVPRMAAATGTDHPLVLVDGLECGSRSLMKLAEKVSLNSSVVKIASRGGGVGTYLGT